MNIVAMLQRWMDSKIGQTFLNYAYSWGASVVILGTLFKLTHLPGANLMLFIGMGTEVVVFFLSAFDRPFEKGADDTETPATQPGAAVGAATTTLVGGTETIQGATSTDDATATTQGIAASGATGTTVVGGGGTIVIGGGTGFGQCTSASAESGEDTGNQPMGEDSETANTPFAPSEGLQSAASQQGLNATSLLDIIRLANEELLQRAQASLTPEMEEASKQYVEKLQLLTETLDRVEKQSARLTTDSEEMTNLNRTLTGINTVYELQLKSVSQQIGTIDSINEQTRRMAAQIEELNGVYARMIKALTVNMKNAANNVAD